MGNNVCPRCGSNDVVIDGSLVEFGANNYICKKCSYRGPIAIRQTIKKDTKMKGGSER